MYLNNISSKKIIVVTPVYDDALAANLLFKDLLLQYEESVFVLAVDDGSVNLPVKITQMNDLGLSGAILALKRNTGHQKAIAIGLNYIQKYLEPHHYIVVMDSDGEDKPASIQNLIDVMDKTAADVVVGTRRKRVERITFKFYYGVYKFLFHIATGRKINFGSFMLLKVKSVDRLVAMPELFVHIAATLIASKLNIINTPIDRGPRYHGLSKANFSFQVLHGIRAVMVFSENVLVRAVIACFFIVAMATMLIIFAIFLKIFGYATPGWFSVATGILVIILIQTSASMLIGLLLIGFIKGNLIHSKVNVEDFIEKISFSYR
jgi:glycosyltransferase involved in cell wall biosynthesis